MHSISKSKCKINKQKNITELIVNLKENNKFKNHENFKKIAQYQHDNKEIIFFKVDPGNVKVTANETDYITSSERTNS